MAFSNGYIVGFAFGVCVVCSLLVSGAAVSLKDQQDLNRERDLHKSILEALQLGDPGMSGDAIDRLWEERVELVIFTADGQPVDAASCAQDLTGDGTCSLEDTIVAREQVKGTSRTPPLLALYKRVDDGKAGAWAMPVYGKGLWGPVAGYLALSPDLSQVIGTTFFGPKETPGLGAEIEQPPFESQWQGKQIFAAGKPKGICVGTACKPGTDAAHRVDGVSGATITSRGVSEMVVRGIEKDYAQTLVRLKGGR